LGEYSSPGVGVWENFYVDIYQEVTWD
jgi:hypothetical protein